MWPADEREESFIVRVRHDSGGDRAGGSVWTGFVQHLASGEQVHFRKVATLVMFLMRHAGISDDSH